MVDQIRERDFNSNVYDAPNLESFLKVMLLKPHSFTTDFNFPQSDDYGRGSGEGGQHYDTRLLVKINDGLESIHLCTCRKCINRILNMKFMRYHRINIVL